MSIKTATVFTCDKCKCTEHSVEGTYDTPIEWFTIRISKNITASTADDLHICSSCQYESIENLWQTI